MYVALWSDPDLGDYADDLVGCDTTRSLGFVYNGLETDRTYAPLPPPAVGFDFFQGPMVSGAPTDSAIFNGKRVYGKRNLPMSGFFPLVYTGQAPEAYDDPRFDRDGYVAALQWYNLLRGFMKYGTKWKDPSGAINTFPFAGDPDKKTGWLDGQLFPASDRRMGLSSGSFTMAPGDTQEVVLAEIAAGAIPGITRTKAVTLLKQYDDEAQAAYDNFFNLPSAPPAPKVAAIALDREIVLSWGDDIAAVAATENSNVRGYKFQGYNVYQLPNAAASISEAIRLATYDLIDGVQTITGKTLDPSIGEFVTVGKQFGTDNGIKRFYRVTTDAFNSDFPLVNGTPYYFAITSYNYSADSLADPKTFENTISIVTVVPHSVDPGTRYASVFGDTVKGVVQTTASGSAASDGKVIPLVVDPTKLNGHTYKVTFDTAAVSTTWSLTDQTAGSVRLSKQKNQSGDDAYLTTDGIIVKVFGPLPGLKTWEIPSGTRRFSPVGGYFAGLEGFGDATNPSLYNRNSGTIGMAGNFVFGGIGTNLSDPQYHTVLLKLAAVDTGALWNPKATPTDANYSRAYRWLRSVGTTSSPAEPKFAPWIINKGSGYPYQDYNYAVPFSAWDMDANPPVRLAVGVLENNVVGGLIDGRYWPPIANIGDNAVSREFCFIFAKPYTDTPDPTLQINLSNSVSPLMWVMTCTRRNAPWAAGDQFKINAIPINTPANTFTFTAPQNTINDVTLAREDISMINVFPNPYYGANPLEQDKYYRFITFTHLPQKAVIRIFNLAGVLVKRINKETTSQFERWDLKNEDGLPVGSGLYIAHIEMPGLGVNKILKIAVVQEQQILDRY